jgi:hypothetical protein
MNAIIKQGRAIQSPEQSLVPGLALPCGALGRCYAVN